MEETALEHDGKSIYSIALKIEGDFECLQDWTLKYEYLIEIGRGLPPMEAAFKTDKNLVKGCQSRVWLISIKEADRIIFQGDSDAPIPKGIVALMIKVLSGHTKDEVSNADLSFVDRIGLTQHLSASRVRGLQSIISKMKTASASTP